jgi:hypothetical protein
MAFRVHSGSPLEETAMLIRHFIPLAVAVIALLCVAADKVGVPVPPVAIISTFAACLLLLQVEDQKVGDMVGDLIRTFKDHRRV